MRVRTGGTRISWMLVLVIAATAAVVSLATRGSGATRTTPSRKPALALRHPSQRLVSSKRELHVSTQLTSHYELFRGVIRDARVTSSPAGSTPAATMLQATGPYGTATHSLGLNPQAQKDVSESSTIDMTITPGADGFCATLSVSDGTSAFSCASLQESLSTGSIAFLRDGQTYYTWGVVPNGIASVMVDTSSGGAPVIARTVDNTFVVKTAGPAQGVSFQSPSGAQVTIRNS